MKNLLFLFVTVLLIQSQTFSQTKFNEVILGSDTLICTDMTGASSLADYIAKLESENTMIPLLDSAVGVCTLLVKTKSEKIEVLQAQKVEGKRLLENNQSIMFKQQRQIDNDLKTIDQLGKDIKKLKRKNRFSWVVGGVTVAGLLTGILVLAL